MGGKKKGMNFFLNCELNTYCGIKQKMIKCIKNIACVLLISDIKWQYRMLSTVNSGIEVKDYGI